MNKRIKKLLEQDRKDREKAEDTAAVLMGKVKCPYCRGTGKRSWTLEDSKCRQCQGKRWLKKPKDPTDEYVKVIQHLDGIVGGTTFVG
jgi:DnaJ-class molecular chaperone